MKMKGLKILMIDFRELYKALSNQDSGNQKKIPVDSCLEVFFGFSTNGNLRLSFMSRTTPPNIESTTILHVIQGRENKNTYWTSLQQLLRLIFLSPNVKMRKKNMKVPTMR